MTVEIDNRQDKMIFDTAMKDVIHQAVASVMDVVGREKNVEVSVVLVDDPGIRELNRTFRNVDRSTDVLSFPMIEAGEDAGEMDIDPETGEIFLGDIVISLETARRQAEDFGHSLAREVGYLTVHGCLHLLGYDHEAEAEKQMMRLREEEALGRIGLSREGEG